MLIIFVDLSNDIFKFIDAVNNGCTPIELDKYCIRSSLPHFVNSKDTILIIDEIQYNSTVYNSIRRLYNNLNCDIIVTGSYLGRILQSDDFFLPAGTLSYAHMFTLSFSEFCRIFNSEKELMSLDLFGNSDISTYGKLEKLYKIYLQIGGYPEVVKRYLETKSIPECYNILEKLLYTFKLESRVYFKQAREVEIFDCVYREALKQMCSRENSGKKALGTLTTLVKDSTDLIVNKSEVANAVIWLQYAGIISTCNLALNGNLRNIIEDRKIYFTDCGIVSYLSSKSLLDKTSLAGLITETFVYNELHRLFKVPNNVSKVSEDEVCFSTYNNYELDFLISDKAGIVYGIEVNNTDKLNIYKDNKSNTFTIPIYTVGCRFPYN